MRLGNTCLGFCDLLVRGAIVSGSGIGEWRIGFEEEWVSRFDNVNSKFIINR